VLEVAGDFAVPNGMAVTPDNATLMVADSHAHESVAFDIGADSGCRRVAPGPTRVAALRTASAPTLKERSGVPTCPTALAHALNQAAACSRP
jgi:hypothetical protein